MKMYSLEMVAVTDFTEEIMAKVQQNVEPEKFMEYCYSINESATESAKTMKNGVKTMFAKFIANVFEEDEMDAHQKNPFMIDLVVRNVMKYLEIKDLRSCRQVCRLWNQEASCYFRRKQRIIFYPESIEKIQTFTAFRKAQEELNFQKLPPFETYCFTAQYPKTQFPRLLLQNLVHTCGQYVKKLEIFYPDDGLLSRQDFKAFFLGRGMPNLESIHFVNLPRILTQISFLEKDVLNADEFLLSAVTHLRIDRTWQMETSWKETFLQDLLSLMPNLIDYELWTWNSTTEDEHSKPYLVSLSPHNRQNLKTLRPGSIGDNLGITIADLGLKLCKLYLPVLNRNISAKTIELLLESQKTSLEECQVNCSTMQNSRLILFPRMEKLKTLHIIITYPWNNDYTTFTPTINYEAQFPYLQMLKLELAIYNDFGFISYFFPPGPTVCLTLKELDISFSGFRDEKFIGCVARIFPNIKRLRLDGYGSKIFSSICLHMQNLEYLELYLIYGFNVDSEMTGIPKDVCAAIRKSSRATSEFKLDEVQLYPSLCSLSKLQKLVICQKDYQAKFWPDSQCITNVTAYFALAYMKQLRHLHIESVKFTEECHRYLAAALEDCWLDFT